MESKKKPGRKRITFTEEQLEEIKHLAGLGVSESAIADKMGVSLSTIARRKRDSDKFDTTLKAGKLKAVAEVSNALFDSATGRNGNPPNVSAQIFFLKNRGEGVASWSDVQKIENTFSLGDVINSARERIPGGTQTAKRLDESIDKGQGIFLDRKDSPGELKNNDSESLSPSKSKSES
jgi:transcriptional regulator with XRE-family HTH domain